MSVPYDAALTAMSAAARAFVDAGLRTLDTPATRAHLEHAQGEWVAAMVRSIERDWWPMWPEGEQSRFLHDMEAMRVRYSTVVAVAPLTARMVRLAPGPYSSGPRS